jgi:tetratricopeptide (TPR) repeat protein
MGESEEELLRKLRDGDGDHEKVIMELCYFYQQRGQPLRAIPLIKSLLASTENIDRAARHYLNLGQLMEQANDYVSAASFYIEGLALESSDTAIQYFLHNNLGFCLNVFGEYDEAEKFLEEAIRIDPNRQNAHKSMGIALEGQNRYEEAVLFYMRGVAANPLDTRARQHLESLLSKHEDIQVDRSEVYKLIEGHKKKN